VLARLEAIEGVTTAEVDHRGELLRLSAADGRAVADAAETLRELGYGSDPVPEPVDRPRWYGRDTVGELSREEGEVIAQRVVRGFARARGLTPGVAERLESAVAGALGAYFARRSIAATTPPGALRDGSVSAVREAAEPLIGPDLARELAVALGRDLNGLDGRTEDLRRDRAIEE